MASSFPKAIWDGTSRTRRNTSYNAPPDHADWLRLISEIQSIETFLLVTVGNMAEMPDLPAKIKEVNVQISDVLDLLKKITPPTDLQNQYELLAKDIQDLSAINIETRLTRIGADVLLCQSQFKELSESLTKLADMTRLEQKKIDAYMRNKQVDLAAETNKRLSAMEQKIATLYSSSIAE